MELRIEPLEGHLLATSRGKISADEVPAMFRRILDAASARGMRRILLDFLEMEGRFSSAERVSFAEQFVDDADLLRLLPQIAVAGRPPVINGLAAEAARGRGIQIRVFPTLSEAREWLGVASA